MLAFLAERGYPDAEAVHSAEESLIFALPPELRRDLRAAEKAAPDVGRSADCGPPTGRQWASLRRSGSPRRARAARRAPAWRSAT